MPNRPSRASSTARCSRHSPSGTITSPAAGIATPPAAAGLSNCQLSATTCRCLMMTAINIVLERFDADTPHHVDKTFCFAVAPREIKFDQMLDHGGHLRLRHPPP